MLLKELKNEKVLEYEYDLDYDKIKNSFIPQSLNNVYMNPNNNLFYDITTPSLEVVNDIISNKAKMIDYFNGNQIYYPRDEYYAGSEKRKEQLAIVKEYLNGCYYMVAPKIMYYDGIHGKYYLKTIIVPEANYSYDEKSKLYTIRNVIELPDNLFKIHAYANGDINFICENNIFLDEKYLPFFNKTLNNDSSKALYEEKQIYFDSDEAKEYLNKCEKILKRIK